MAQGNYNPPMTPAELIDRFGRGERQFPNVQFENANFSGARLRGIAMPGAHLASCDFSGAYLGQSILVGARLRASNFSKSKLSYALLADADMSSAQFTGADLFSAQCEGATLLGADLRDARVQKANLRKTDLRFAYGLEFDENDITETRLPARPSSFGRYQRSFLPGGARERLRHFWDYVSYAGYPKWLMLVRTYTGPWLAVYVILTVAFLLPQIGAALLLNVLAVAERHSPYTAAGWESLRLWQIILGVQRGVLATVLTCTLFVFNISRAFVTVKVSALRHNQSLSNATPALSEYSFLVKLHKIVKLLWFVAISELLWEICRLLGTKVSIPPLR